MLEQPVQGFLHRAGWASAATAPLAGDASARRYLRLSDNSGRQAVLMCAPPAPDDSTARFVAIAEHLSQCGLSAPQILAAEPEAGLLLLEDLGDAVLARVIEAAPDREASLYAAAVDVLFTLHSAPAPPKLPAPTAADLASLVAPVCDWYAEHEDAEGLTAQLARQLTLLLARHMTASPLVFAHRDYHAENLIWLPERVGPARLGVLDFQDAFLGHPAYDLVSLLEDARRDLAPGTREQTVAYYLQRSGAAPDTFAESLAIFGAQRNLRILGIFARLSLHFGKAHYVDLIPRVWGHLQRDLSHPALSDLQALVAAELPEPSPALLQGLKDRCGTIPRL